MITKEMFIEDAKTLTAKEMAAKYQTSLFTIYKKVKQLGVKVVRKGRGSKFDAEQIKKDWESMACEEIMTKHGMSKSTARKYKIKRRARKFDF
jgi:transposase